MTEEFEDKSKDLTIFEKLDDKYPSLSSFGIFPAKPVEEAEVMPVRETLRKEQILDRDLKDGKRPAFIETVKTYLHHVNNPDAITSKEAQIKVKQEEIKKLEEEIQSLRDVEIPLREEINYGERP